jgi:predicted ArsR family transcriptional regulator
MSSMRQGVGLFGTTRGQIVLLLRRASRTVNELAEVLGLSDNAIRTHLTVLERDGLVQQGAARRGIGKPAFVYRLTPEAERLFPNAHETVLGRLLDVMGTQIGEARREGMLREVGYSIAGAQTLPGGNLRERLESGVAVLNNLGGLVELEEHEDTFSVCGYSCPLAGTPVTHPESCKLVESLLSTLAGVPVHERCARSETLSCWFEVSRL